MPIKYEVLLGLLSRPSSSKIVGMTNGTDILTYTNGLEKSGSWEYL